MLQHLASDIGKRSILSCILFLLNVKQMCVYLGIGQTKAHELLADPKNNFMVSIGNRLYAHKGRLDTWLLNRIL